MDLSSALSLPFITGAVLVYCVILAIYRLYLTPVAKFPGPKLAALSLWYEFYYDVIKRGKYTWEIEKMHQRYGPIVRINPYELHINDPEYYDVLYVSGSVRRTAKWPWQAKMYGQGSATVATPGHEEHRMRRAALNPFFSKQSVNRLEPVVQTVVDNLLSRLEGIKGTGRIVNLVDAFTALTGDVICQYSFDRTFGMLDDPDFAPEWHRYMMDEFELSHKFKQFGWLEPTMNRLPRWVVKLIDPELTSFFTFQDTLLEQITGIKKDLGEGQKTSGQKTIFYDILMNDQVRSQEKESKHLVVEAQVVVSAGIVTTAHTLQLLAFYILEDPKILERLQQELAGPFDPAGTQPTWRQLEKLPYLTALINEALRIGHGITHRLARVSPDVALQYKEWNIPIGTPVSMSATLNHTHPSIFPDPFSFKPDRWLEQSDVRLTKYLVAFSKGSRQCVGMNLAYCEMYLAIAAMFAPGRFQFDLFETSRYDVEIAHDFISPCLHLDSKGIRVMVK